MRGMRRVSRLLFYWLFYWSSKPPGGSSGSDLRDGLLVSASSASMEQGEGVSMLGQQHVQFTPPTDRGQSCWGPPHVEPFLVLA